MSVAIRWRIAHALVKFENRIHLNRDSVTHLIIYFCNFVIWKQFLSSQNKNQTLLIPSTLASSLRASLRVPGTRCLLINRCSACGWADSSGDDFGNVIVLLQRTDTIVVILFCTHLEIAASVHSNTNLLTDALV